MKNTLPFKTKTLHDETVAMSQFLDAMFRVPETEKSAVICELPVVNSNHNIQDAIALDVQEYTEAVKIEYDSPDQQWFENDFQAMIIDIGVLKLTLPLLDLVSIVDYPTQLTEIPGQTDWIMGVFQYHGETIKVVDTTQLVVPGNSFDSDMVFQKIVIIDGQWALACQSISDVIHVQKQDVRWRHKRGNRTWLAGTLIKKLSGLIDVKEFIATLDKQTISEK